MSDTFVSRWGSPELDDNRYISIPGFIIKNWAKFVSIQEWVFIIQAMSHKFDSPCDEPRPDLSELQKQIGYKNVRSIQTIRQQLVSRNLLLVKECNGLSVMYDFSPFIEKCRKESLSPKHNLSRNKTKKKGKSYIRRFGQKLVERDGGWFCHYCKKELCPSGTPYKDPNYYHIFGYGLLDDEPLWGLKPQFDFASVDHIKLRRDGGTDELNNLVLACWTCNVERNVKPYEEFLRFKKGVSHDKS